MGCGGLSQCSCGQPGRQHGAQVQPLQEGPFDVPLEVEEEEDAPHAEEATQDEAALEVKRVEVPRHELHRAAAAIRLVLALRLVLQPASSCVLRPAHLMAWGRKK